MFLALDISIPNLLYWGVNGSDVRGPLSLFLIHLNKDEIHVVEPELKMLVKFLSFESKLGSGQS
ncbi:hypothetical protein A3763_08100 [Oleiphilus sp. HI0128]|nr:hypothetical protein A3763_08100 [Oleiphilus sp. HI0128]